MAEIIEKPKSFSDTAKDVARRFLRHENAVLIVVLIALIAGLSVITRGLTTSKANMMNILYQSSIRGVASVGQAFVILTAGIDLSVGGIGLMSSFLGATMMTEALQFNIIGYPMSMYVVIPIVLLVGAGWGAINGSSVSRIGMPPLIVTLAMWQIAKGVAFSLNSGLSVASQPESVANLGLAKVAGVPVLVIIFILVAVIAYFVLNHTTFGRSIYAVGGNPVSAWLSGINLKRTQFIVYVISGLLAGLGGIMSTARAQGASMQTLSALMLDTIASVCVGGVSLFGGRGSLIGVVLGVLIIGVVNNGLSVLGASTTMKDVIKGVIIFTAVAVDYIRRR